MKIKYVSLLLAIAALPLLCATPLSLRAATLTVTSTADSGSGTLRDALGRANGGDTLTFAVTGTIRLTSGQLSVNRNLTILGPGAWLLTVSGNRASRVFDITGADVTISGLRIAEGQGALEGAGIRAAGNPGSVLKLSDCLVTSNSTTLNGGGIFSGPGASLTVSNCTISANYANMDGGGIYLAKSSLSLLTSTVRGNSAGFGGGIMNDGEGGAGSVTVVASTLCDNSASSAGAILNWGQSGSATLKVICSTLSFNSASYGGGAIDNNGWQGNGTVLIHASTLCGNSAPIGASIYNTTYNGNAALQLGDSILKVGASGANIVNERGAVASAGYNLSSDDGSGFLTAASDHINTDPRLGPLESNTGRTMTHALLAGSPAIDQGKADAIPTLARATDQAGRPRPVDSPEVANAPGGDGSDIGAYERQPDEDYSYYLMDDGTLVIGGYEGTGGAVTVPSTINGLAVAAIGDYAFFNCANLTGVTIPAGVTSIWGSAFYGCTRLATVAISASVTNISDSAFYRCSRLAAITVDPLNPAYSSVDGVLFDRARATLLNYPPAKAGSYAIPNGVITIGAGAFQLCSSLTSVTIPSSVTGIGEGAFMGCCSLAGVTIPASVTSIGESAFYFCTSLAGVTIPNGVTNIGDDAFGYCTGLTSTTIPRSVTSIGESPFLNCTRLTAITVDALNAAYCSVEGVLFDKGQTHLIQGPGAKAGIYAIPNSVTAIGRGAFQSCCGLTSVAIPNRVTTIGDVAFKSCSSLTSVVIPSSVASIGPYAFEDCSALTSVAIPASVTNMEGAVFKDCASLAAINVDALNAIYSSLDGVLFNKGQTRLLEFPCGKAGSYTIPSSVSWVEYRAFFSCSRLTSVTMPAGIGDFWDYPFYHCTSLTAITVDPLSAHYSSVDGVLFNKNQSELIQYPGGRAGSYAIPGTVTRIAGYAFGRCSLLSSLTIPAGVTDLGYGVLESCTSLTAIAVDPQNPAYRSVDGILFSKDLSVLCQFPGGRAGRYSVPATVTNIGDYAFCGCAGLTSVTIPNSVLGIGYAAFGYCASLISVTISNSVDLRSYAFADCTNLTSVCFTGNPPAIDGSWALEDHNRLTFYYLPGAAGWGPTFAGRPTALATPSIAGQPVSQSVFPGNPATFAVTAAGMPPITYQWRKNGASLAGATQSTFAIARAQTTNAGAYSVAVSNLYGGVISLNAKLALDTLKPTVTILTPTAGRRITNTSPVTIAGKTGDNLAVASVWCQLNGTGWQPATTANGWTNWGVTVSPKAGTNTVRAYAVDSAGNRSLTNSRSFVLVTFSSLSLSLNGPGTVSPTNLNGSLLEVGRSYTVTATPRAGCLLSNWVGTPAGLPSTSTTLRFLMESNAVLTANFVTNPFPAVKGSYYGLFADPDRGQDSSGLVSLALTTSGAYSGSLKRGANSYAVSGQFDVGGRARQSVSRLGTNAWRLELMLLFGDQAIVGAVSNGVSGGWVAGLLAYRAGFDARTNPATQYAGKYTLIIPGGQELSLPQGIGYAAIGVSSNGLATLAGSLADSTNFTQAVPVSQRGLLPVYASLYGGKGSVWGWLEFESSSPAAHLEGDLRWLRPPLPGSRYYPAGFACEAVASGSRYTPPASANQRVLSLTNGVVMFDYGNLAEPIINQITLTASNRAINLSSNKLTLNFTLPSGLFSGSVQVPGTTRNNAFKGMLLQDRPAGFGYFLGTNQSGRVLLGPAN